MRPTQRLLSGAEEIGKHNKYLGHGWGSFGTPVQKQKGIVTYGLAPNRQNPFAGAAHAAVFNTWRRFSSQVLYVVPPFIAAYFVMGWAIERNHYLNSKAGIAEFAADEE
ncbi:UcrQ-domain-containing protein [Cryphonectria parasitica EP155]|uniref:Cytochrome b-c1 complex subunit 8 n=1 Tax=Cryphonectria parasitica (strain ATCC 38755 / EP155) TaxID=660469 RepID=A0A9P4XX39_CRYP1|nr:UcrQ-domain-containing protein [Cryphonectria parasitica EP155]KAF3762894.1 UcrQ-domain-containing protein [Cryphonectria parasitica EP155]